MLWSLDRETFNTIVKTANEKKRELYSVFLKSIDLLSEMQPNEIDQISDSIQVTRAGKDTNIITQGENGDNFYIIEEGEAFATIRADRGQSKLVKSYGRGDYFGELALIKNEPRAATVTAKVLIILTHNKD